MSATLRIAAVVLAGVAAAWAQGGGQAADEAALQKLGEQYEQAWVNGDAKSAAAIWAADGTHRGPLGTIERGRAAMEAALAASFAGPNQGARISLSPEPVRFVKPDVAIGSGAWSITGGSGGGPSSGYYMYVATKTGGDWRIVASQSWSPVTPPQ